MSTNGSDHQESSASTPDYQQLAEQAIGEQLYREYDDLQSAHQDLWSALVFEDSETHTGPTELDVGQVEGVLDALAAYQWFLQNRVAALLAEDEFENRFYEGL